MGGDRSVKRPCRRGFLLPFHTVRPGSPSSLPTGGPGGPGPLSPASILPRCLGGRRGARGGREASPQDPPTASFAPGIIPSPGLGRLGDGPSLCYSQPGGSETH